MGQGFSSSTNIFVRLHKTSYCSGETVVGTIYLNAVDEVDVKCLVFMASTPRVDVASRQHYLKVALVVVQVSATEEMEYETGSGDDKKKHRLSNSLLQASIFDRSCKKHR
jgi:hypothetical protein